MNKKRKMKLQKRPRQTLRRYPRGRKVRVLRPTVKVRGAEAPKRKKRKIKKKARIKKAKIKKIIKRRARIIKIIKRKAKKRTRKTPTRKALSQKPVYALNPGFEFFYELRDLILKSSPAEKDKMIKRLNKIGRIKLAVISGIFINKENLDPLVTDLFLVGDDIDRRKLRAFLRATEAEVGKEIKFTLMDKEEFQYRLAMFDRFFRVLLEGPHEKLINRLGI